jgi:membrane protein YdbS with pleckstrin-like domain/ribosomal protein L12E/L44/L45/RPP1/RPP2
MNDLVEQGNAALKMGDRARARFLLRSSLEKNQDNLQAWLGLSEAAEMDEDRLECMQQVMRIDPGNMNAAREISRLTGKDIDTVLTEAAAAVVVETAISTDKWAENMPLAENMPEPVLPQETKEAAGAESGRILVFEEGKLIFKATASLIPALALGWTIIILFFFLLPVVMSPNLVTLSFLPPVFTLGILVIVILFLWQMVVALTTRYSATTRGVKITTGLFKRTRQFILISDLQRVTCQRTFLQKMAGIGNLVLELKTGDSEQKVTLINVTQCDQKAKKLQQILSDQETA